MPPSFSDHVALLGASLDRRALIVEAVERQILNVQDKETSRSRDRGRLERLLSGSFHAAVELPYLSGAFDTLTAAHVDYGFEPVSRDRHSHRLDPVDLVARAYDHWDATRWPGRNGRIAFAHVVYGAFMLGLLEHLSLRIWDSGVHDAEGNLREVQRLLDRLNGDSSGPVFIRDARWLIQTAQGPLTKELAPYFRIAARIAESFDAGYRLEVHKAGAVLAGGHLRSQQRYRASETGRAFDDPQVLAVTRNSNSMDVALLAGDLVALLERYEAALGGEDDSDADLRRGLADAILQGLSADPDLLITRLELLGPATMVEEVFVDAAAEGPRYTAPGERHAALIRRYRDLLTRLAAPLCAECLELDPAGRAYSPLGISYGFCADVLWNVAVGTLTARPSSSLSLEDLFESRTRLDEKATRAHTWEQLPTSAGEHQHFTHSPEWAQQVFGDVIDRLRRLGSRDAVARTGRLFVRLQSIDSLPGSIPDSAVSAQEHVVTSDIQWALNAGATAFPKSHLLADRREGRYLASVEQDGKWFAVSKVLLTACLAQGRDAVIAGVPDAVAVQLRVTCPEIVNG